MKTSPNKWLSLIPLLGAIAGAIYLYNASVAQSSFLGLPTVPCLDPTKPIVQNYTLRIVITIDGSAHSLSPAIGHEPGNCLRAIHTNDATGLVYVETNDVNQYTLGNFFQAWRKTFDTGQLAEYPVTAGHALQVLVNGAPVSTFETTPLVPSSTIDVVYR